MFDHTHTHTHETTATNIEIIISGKMNDNSVVPGRSSLR